MDGDDARKRFLAPLIDELGAAWTHEYDVDPTFDVLALVLRHPALEHDVEVVPSVVWKNVISWKPFPGTGTPHYDIRFRDALQRTGTFSEAAAILGRFLRSQAPAVRSASAPVLDTMRPILEAIARAPAVALGGSTDIERWPPTAEGTQLLDAIRGDIDLERVALAFPRDDDGRLKLATQVLLAEIPTQQAAPRGRAVYATLRGPRTRGDGDRLALALEDAIFENASHRWVDAPWLWRRGHADPNVDDDPAVVALLDAGRFDEALARCDIGLSDRAIRTLERATASRHGDEDRAMLRRTLWHLAPWRLPRRGRLALLPHQTHQVKAWIVVHDGVIDLENTGSNARLAESDWKRPIATDLARLGIARRATAARAPAAKKVIPQKTLAELLDGADLMGAIRARDIAKRRPPADVRAELLAVMSGPAPSGERAYALFILGEIGSEEDGVTLSGYLQDPDLAIRRAAIDALGRIGHVAAVPTLARLALRDETVAVPALLAMRALSGKRGSFGLIAYLDHEDPRVREAACQGLNTVGQGYKSARAALLALRSDPDAAVAAAAEAALARIVQ